MKYSNKRVKKDTSNQCTSRQKKTAGRRAAKKEIEREREEGRIIEDSMNCLHGNGQFWTIVKGSGNLEHAAAPFWLSASSAHRHNVAVRTTAA